MVTGLDEFRSGDALVVFDSELRVRSWNRAAEELTGIPAEEAIGSHCWELLGGEEESGSVVCHAGCSNARHAREGWPVRSCELLIRAAGGRKRVSVSTIALRKGEEPLFVHLLREAPEPKGAPEPPRPGGPAPRLTRRQLEVLELLGEGLHANAIHLRLGIAETTVRNHIRAILLELGSHSQLEAVVRARGLGLI